MAHVDTQWALKSILQFSHHQRRAAVAAPATSSTMSSSSALRVSAMPRIMQAADHSRVLLLARRTNGIAGVEIGFGGRVRWTPPAATLLDGGKLKASHKARLLASYLQRRGYETIPAPPHSLAGPRTTPLVLHTNHFIGWKLNPGSAAYPLYAHSLEELRRLRSAEVATLHPRDCLVADAYTEWDNWREVLGEPGWDFFSASDDTVERLVHDGIAAPLVDAQDGVCKVEFS